MLAKKSLLKSDIVISNKSSSKEPFRVGRYIKSSNKNENEQQQQINDVKISQQQQQQQQQQLSQQQTLNKNITKSNKQSNNLYVLKEENYTTSYHSFNSLENINLAQISQTFTNDNYYEISKSKIDPRIASIKSKYDNNESFIIDRSSNKFFDDSFLSDKTESLIDDAQQFIVESEIFDENFNIIKKTENDKIKKEEKPKDFSCQGIYLEACKKQKVIPASYFLRHMNDPVLKMKHHGLGAPGIKPLSVALVTNTKVVKLDVSDNWLGPTGTESIAKMMKDNCYIYDLNMSDNHLGLKGSEILNDMLKQNTTLTHLYLQGNNFDDNSAALWADILMNNTKLEFLDLSHNSFGEAAGKLLGPAISENTSLKHLILSWNNLRRKGAVAIAKGLQTNIILKKFDISWNGISQDGAKALLKTLKENEVLEELDISNNRISTEGAVYIGKGLATNQALKVLKIGKNPMESAGCFAIIKALQKNANTKLEEIDFSEITVDKFFNEELDEFQKIFPNIVIKTGSDDVKLKPKVRLHPILKLRNYIEKHHIRLIDFFNKFDKDGSMNVTREEFVNGLTELGINLQADEVQQLLDELDTDGDGDINYSSFTELMEKRVNGK